MTAKAELAARFDRVLSALRDVIATATARDSAWEETKKGVVGAYAEAGFAHTRARRAFEDETPTMDALAIDLKDNRYKDPSWPTDGDDHVQMLLTIWHSFHGTIGAGRPFAPDELSAMPNLYAALERAREKLTRDAPSKGAVFCRNSGVLTVNGKPLARLEGADKYVLTLLVERGAASFSDPKTAHDRPDKVLKALRTKYPALKNYISLPGGPGRGGYSTTIVLEE